jgi:hypothetical protein
VIAEAVPNPTLGDRLTERNNLVAPPGCIPVPALERFLQVRVILDDAKRHSREGLDIRTAKPRSRMTPAWVRGH